MTLTEIGGGAIVLGAVALLGFATREPRRISVARQDRHSL
jgi:hypothetical protein